MKKLNNITTKIDLFLKKLSKKKKIYLETEISIIDFISGKKVEKASPNAYIINLKQIFQKNIVRTKNKPNFPFVYKKKDGTYIASNQLLLSMIYEALTDFYGDKLFVLSDNKTKLSLFMYDKDNYKTVEKNEEYNVIKEDFFQGLEPREVNIYDAIHLVVQKSGKKVLTLLIIIAVFLVVIVMKNIFQSTGGMENLNIPKYNPNAKKSEKTITQKEFNRRIPYNVAQELATNYFISKLFHNEYVNNIGVILKHIDYKTKKVDFITFYPYEGFKFDGKYYKKSVMLIPSIQTLWNIYLRRIIHKNPIDCEKEITKYTKKITYVDDEGKFKIFSFKKSLKPEKVSNFLANLYGCPIILEGKTDYNFIKDTTTNDIKIKLFY